MIENESIVHTKDLLTSGEEAIEMHLEDEASPYQYEERPNTVLVANMVKQIEAGTTKCSNNEIEVAITHVEPAEYESGDRTKESNTKPESAVCGEAPPPCFREKKLVDMAKDYWNPNPEQYKKKLQDACGRLKKAESENLRLSKLNASLKKDKARLTEELHSLRQKNKWYDQKLKKAKHEVSIAKEQALVASSEKAALFEMLETQTVKRDSRAKFYPNDKALCTYAKKYQEETEEYFQDMADVLIEDNYSTKDVHRAVLWRILAEVSTFAAAEAMQFVHEKRSNLVALVGDKELIESNTLVSLLWRSYMQHRVVESKEDLRSKAYKYFCEHLEGWKDTGNNCEMLEWSIHPEIMSHPDMNDRNIIDIFWHYVYLELLCRFSDPECFLFPDIGTPVKYNEKHQKLISLNGKFSRVPEGSSVSVVYPGLYFAHPDTMDGNELIAPSVKALVVPLP